MNLIKRREFLAGTTALGAAAACGVLAPQRSSKAADAAPRMQFGLVTYLWGKDMDLPTVIDACAKSGMPGVELRTQHAHGVEPSLSKTERREVRERFANSPVTLVGYGSNAQFHEDDPAKVKQNIELTKQYIHLMHDCGGTGVKVKPNGFVPGVPHEKTISQIGRALNEVAAYGAGYGQQIRVEAHGRGTSELPVMKAIFEVADHPNVAICWNSNDVDLEGKGLEYNFNLVKDRFGDTLHVRELDSDNYPYARLMRLLVDMDYSGWVLLEARTDPSDKIRAMAAQRKIFDRMVTG